MPDRQTATSTIDESIDGIEQPESAGNVRRPDPPSQLMMTREDSRFYAGLQRSSLRRAAQYRASGPVRLIGSVSEEEAVNETHDAFAVADRQGRT